MRHSDLTSRSLMTASSSKMLPPSRLSTSGGGWRKKRLFEHLEHVDEVLGHLEVGGEPFARRPRQQAHARHGLHDDQVDQFREAGSRKRFRLGGLLRQPLLLFPGLGLPVVVYDDLLLFVWHVSP